MSGTSCCGAMAGSCFCGVNAEDSPGYVPAGFTQEEWEAAGRAMDAWKEAAADDYWELKGLSEDIYTVLQSFGIEPSKPEKLSQARRAALDAVGFDEVGDTQDLTDEDAVQVLAFHKFLSAGQWKNLPPDQKVCRNCGQAIYKDDWSGFWMHSTPYADKVNGYYCYEGCWDGSLPASNASPDHTTRKVFEVDQASFDYATGIMDAWEYLDSALDSAKNEDPVENEAS